jgi:hypothetical protein
VYLTAAFQVRGPQLLKRASQASLLDRVCTVLKRGCITSYCRACALMNEDGQVGELSGLSGSLPAGLGSLSSLTYLDLKGNMLSGRLPDPLPTTLASARLAGNYLTGTIPASYGAPWQCYVQFMRTCYMHWASSCLKDF